MKTGMIALCVLVPSLQKDVQFTGKISKTRWGTMTGWKGEWRIPFAALGITPALKPAIPLNIRVHITETGEWRGWEAALGRLAFSE